MLWQLTYVQLRSLRWKLPSANGPDVKEDLDKRSAMTKLLFKTLRSMTVSSIYPRSTAKIRYCRYREMYPRWVENCRILEVILL